MSRQPPINRLFPALFSVWLIATGVRADGLYGNVSGGTTEPAVLQVEIKNGELVGNDQIRRIFITLGTNQFLIVIPGGARADVSKPDQLTLVSKDYNYYMGFRVLGGPETSASVTDADSCRDIVLGRYPGANIGEESSEAIANHSGPAFSLHWAGSSGADEFVRVALIPCSAGILEFSVIADEKNAQEGRARFREMLMNFRSNENGKLEVSCFPGAS